MRTSIDLSSIIKEWRCVGVEHPDQIIPLYYDIIKEIINRDRETTYQNFRKSLFEAVKINTPILDEEWTCIVDEENKKLPLLYQLSFEERDKLWHETYFDESSGLKLSYQDWSNLFYEHGSENSNP